MRKSINEVLEDNERLNSDQCWSFYDWFCNDRSLERRAKALLPKLKFLIKEGIVDGDKAYVWFKNSCPMCGELYDDLRISTLGEDNRFLGGICPRTGHYNSKMKCMVWWFEGRDMRSKEFPTWSDAKKAIKNNEKGLKDKLIKAYSV